MLLLAPLAGAADERIGVMAAALEQPREGTNGAIVLNATFEFELPQALEEAVQKGIALYFNIEFELFRKRWYWFDRLVASQTLVYRLSYSPLTRQYRLARGGLSQPFDSLEEALALDEERAQLEGDGPGAAVPARRLRSPGPDAAGRLAAAQAIPGQRDHQPRVEPRVRLARNPGAGRPAALSARRRCLPIAGSLRPAPARA